VPAAMIWRWARHDRLGGVPTSRRNAFLFGSEQKRAVLGAMVGALAVAGVRAMGVKARWLWATGAGFERAEALADGFTVRCATHRLPCRCGPTTIVGIEVRGSQPATHGLTDGRLPAPAGLPVFDSVANPRRLAGFRNLRAVRRAGRSEDAPHRAVVHIQPGGDLVDLHPLRVERQNALHGLRGLRDLAGAQHNQRALRMNVPRVCIEVEFPRFVVVEILVHVEVEVHVVALGGRLFGARHSASSASVAWAIDTSMIKGHDHASISGMPERTTKSRNASNDRTNATAARNAVIISANWEVTFDRRPLRTSSDNPSIEAIKMFGGATATPTATGAGTARSVATSECAALPAIDAELAMIRIVQKNHFARRSCRRASTSIIWRPEAVNESAMR
jgi:hypothetical protein